MLHFKEKGNKYKRCNRQQLRWWADVVDVIVFFYKLSLSLRSLILKKEKKVYITTLSIGVRLLHPLSNNICINENVSYKFADEQIQQLRCTTRTWNMWNSLNLEYQSNRVVCSITGLHIVDWKTNLRFRHLNQRKQNCMSIRSCTGQQRAKMKWEGQSYHVRFFFLNHVMLHLYIFSSAMTCKKLSNNMMDILDL